MTGWETGWGTEWEIEWVIEWVTVVPLAPIVAAPARTTSPTTAATAGTFPCAPVAMMTLDHPLGVVGRSLLAPVRGCLWVHRCLSEGLR